MKLLEILEVLRNGIVVKQNFENRGYPVTRIATISDGVIDGEKVGYADISEIQVKKYRLQFGDILFSHINSVDHIGKTAIYKGKPEILIHGMNLLLLRAKKDVISPDFLHFYLRSKAVRALWKIRAKRAVNQASLNQTNISQLDVPVPNRKIQDKVVSILLKAEKIKQKREQANLITNKILQTVFLQMFGDSSHSHKKWKITTIGEISHVVRGSSPRPKGDPTYYGGKIHRLMIADITRDGSPVYPKIDFLTEEGAAKSRPVKKGTVVIAVSGNVGLAAIVGVDCCIHDGFVGLLNLRDDVNPIFLREYLESIRLINLAKSAGAIWKNLTTSEIKEIEVPLPPLSLQNRFSFLAEKLADLKRKQKDSATESNELMNSLMSKAFKGELLFDGSSEKRYL